MTKELDQMYHLKNQNRRKYQENQEHQENPEDLQSKKYLKTYYQYQCQADRLRAGPWKQEEGRRRPRRQ